MPYALLCVFAVMLDCLTAYRLNRRIKRLLPNAKTDGKLKSARMSKMISDLTVVWLCILLAVGVDDKLLGHLGNLHLGQYVAAIFVLCTSVSILENESSCNGAVWARAVQKVVTSKVSRHLDIDEEELEKLLNEKRHQHDL
ncbi:phage holin family protein [Prevotella sp. MGM1]|uniref:phage holin family protein n=1 Tax=Prevotella sp. MGM1 TaxID=2033405 RepID=UPI0013049EA6|nr:phage holin family protein [Prevotella sp. MGM1]